MSAKTPEERLIDATVAEIERTGLAGVTVRHVAAAAVLNLESVKYY
jgi:DNA-binding transcriptional regulator YbjK